MEKNREGQIAKIIKKCKDRDKFVTKKQEDCKKTQNKSLNIAWKKAEKFNDDIQSYYKSKYIMSRTFKEGHAGNTFHVNTSHREEGEFLEERNERNTDSNANKIANNSSLNIMATSKIYQSLSQSNKINKLYDFTPQKVVLKIPRNEHLYHSVAHESTESYHEREKANDLLLKVKEINEIN